MVARGRSCGVDVSGKWSGVSGGDVHGQIWAFRAQRAPVPYNITVRKLVHQTQHRRHASIGPSESQARRLRSRSCADPSSPQRTIGAEPYNLNTTHSNTHPRIACDILPTIVHRRGRRNRTPPALPRAVGTHVRKTIAHTSTLPRATTRTPPARMSGYSSEPSASQRLSCPRGRFALRSSGAASVGTQRSGKGGMERLEVREEWYHHARCVWRVLREEKECKILRA